MKFGFEFSKLSTNRMPVVPIASKFQNDVNVTDISHKQAVENLNESSTFEQPFIR